MSLLVAALLLSRASLAQTGPMTMPTYNPPARLPTTDMTLRFMYFPDSKSPAYRKGAGSYQLPDGSWHSCSKLIFDGNQLTPKDSTAHKQRFTSETIQQLVVKQDTFLVVKDLPGRKVAPPKPDFLHSCVNRQGIRLLALYYESGRATYFLIRPHVSMQLLPTGRAEFKTAMLAIVKDSPALSAKIASGKLGRDEVVKIVEEYADFRRTNPLH
ncbi:hypothetical protein IC235_01680 [Hymenobacter sp. BT664]|uniref:Uncharacterized protein n=1 Tax=Hymenobacter montanus TaxID=2771359 RepID=A0A927GHR8_9BACT|nr:hypothetical protein [Hymenobacter montanus]MBD2766600.1 hypothetical protein [Hymenobacter montanus]